MWELQHPPFLTSSTRRQATGSWGSGGGEGLGDEEHAVNVIGMGVSFFMWVMHCYGVGDGYFSHLYVN